jgi:predicted small metal-binding protein
MANNPSTGSNQGSTGKTPGSTGNNQGNVKFRCKDVGFDSCPFEATGNNEQDLMPQIERHGKEAHGINQIDQQTRDKVKNAIRRAA